MEMRELVQTYVRQLDVPGKISVPETILGFDQTPSQLAEGLRDMGVPTQAYRLVDRTVADLGFPFMIQHDGEWVLHSPQPGGGFQRLPEQEACTHRARELSDDTTIVGEPPVGIPFFLLRVGGCAPESEAPDVAIFYGSTCDPGELAEEQFVPDAEALVSQAESQKRRVLFIDALGLIPEKTVERYVRTTGGRRQAFAHVFRQIQAETERLGKGGPLPFEPRSPLWRTAYGFLNERRIPGELEKLRFDLWEEIVAFDRKGLSRHALNHFIAGLVEDAANLMAEHIAGFHELNCMIRNSHLAEQLDGMVEERNGPPLFLVLKEIGHYGVLENLLSERFKVQSKILGKERVPVLAKTAGMESIYSNIGVKISREDMRIQALRSCLKMLVVPRWTPTSSLRTTARLMESTAIDRMSLQSIEAVIEALHNPSRSYLRNAPHNQSIQDQLMYLLRENGILPDDAVKDPVNDLRLGGEEGGN